MERLEHKTHELHALQAQIHSQLARADDRNKRELQMADQFLASIQVSLLRQAARRDAFTFER